MGRGPATIAKLGQLHAVRKMGRLLGALSHHVIQVSSTRPRDAWRALKISQVWAALRSTLPLVSQTSNFQNMLYSNIFHWVK